ncbi:HVA22-like protein h [Drosophila innubila]|uniref:HVA22-like protein h n=1 Tax=Drosophila innubila TaxID=198719 RepID=UPI00148CE4F5|nr:HVA22-like protein h [Drosophila innubila]
MIYEFLMLIFGWLYPAYATYASLGANQANQVKWMKYWIVFGIFTSFHFLTGCLECWVPFFAAFKLCVLLWLLPNLGGGCQLILEELLDPLMCRNRMIIQQAFNGVSDISSALLRELIKMVYHLLVDVVEQCWQLTRNADDIHVPTRLQAAINEVIAELRAARQAAAPVPVVTPSAAPAALALLPAVAPPEPLPLDVQPNPIANSTPIPLVRAANLTDDDAIQLRILLAEAASAIRMQWRLQSAHQEHLAPIQSVHSQLCTGKHQQELEDVDRAYLEYQAGEQH